MNFSRIIPGAIRAIIDGTTLEIRSDGKFVRDYLYVKDVVEGYLLLAAKIKQAQGQAYNFGSHDTLSVLELLALIERGLGIKIKHKILNKAKNEIPYQSLNFDKIKKEFGWEPEQSVASTIEQIFSWYKK